MSWNPDVAYVAAVVKHEDHDQSTHGSWADQTTSGLDDLIRLAGATDQDIERRAFTGVYRGDLSWFPEEMKNDYGITVTEADARGLVEYLREHAREPYTRRGLKYVYVWRGGHDPSVDYDGVVSAVSSYDATIGNVPISEADDYGDAVSYGEVALFRVPIEGVEMEAGNNVPGEILVNPKMLEPVAAVFKHAEHDQSTHGSWAHGRVRKVVEESLRRASIGESLDADAMGLFLPPGHRDSSTPEEDLAKVVKAQGWDQPAPLLSDDEFKAAYDTGKFTLVYRVGPIGLEQGILKGTPYIGTGYHGPGTYVTDNYLGVLPYVSIDKSRAVVPMLVPTEMIVDVYGRPVINHYQQAATEAQGAVRTTARVLGDGTPYSEYLVFNTSALLVGRPSEFPEPGSINFYVEDLPRGETVDWARFEKSDEWEHGPYYMLVDGKAVLIEFDDDEVVKHEEHDQSTHGSWADGRARETTTTGTPAAEEQSRSITPLGDGRYRYEYGDFTVESDPLDPKDMKETWLDESWEFDSIEEVAEYAVDYIWNQWEGNFAIRNIAEDMMGIGDRYASGGESIEPNLRDAIAYGRNLDDPDEAEAVRAVVAAHAPLAHAMLAAVHAAEPARAYPWEGLVRRAMVVPSFRSDDENPLLRLYEGDDIELGLSGFSPNVNLTDRFLRGGFSSREVLQSGEDFVFEPRWRSVIFELDTSKARTVLPVGWDGRSQDSDNWVHLSYEDRAADLDEGTTRRMRPAPWEVVTAGKFRIVGRREEERTFTVPFSGGEEETENMVVYRLQQTAVFNPATGEYDALDGFITLPDGRVVPVDEA